MQLRVAVLVSWLVVAVGCVVDPALDNVEQAVLPAPTGFSVVGVTPHSISVVWNPVPGAHLYGVERTTPEGGRVGHSVPLSPTSYTFEGLARDTTYRVRVSSIESNGATVYTDWITVTTPSDLVPPTVTATTTSVSTIEVAWAATPLATKYYLFQSTAGGPFSYVTTVLGTTFTSANLAPDTEYSYKVQSADFASHSLDSNIATATTTLEPPGPSPFGAPANVRATPVLSTRIQVDWDVVQDAVKYYVFQAQDAGPMIYVTTVTTNAYTARGLVPNTTYSYVIEAVTAWELASADSSVASARTFLAPPTVTATAISSSRIEVEWAAVPDAVKYYVFQAEGAGASAYVGTMLSTSYSAAGLSAGTVYSYVVQAVDANGNPSSNSAPASATTFGGGVGVVAPDVTATAVSSSRIEVTWAPVAGAVTYYVFQTEGAGASVYVGTATTNAWTAAGLAESTSYTYVVEAVNVAGVTSPGSLPAIATTLSTGPAVTAPSDVVATALSSSQVLVTWASVAGATKYYVFQAETGGPLTYVTSIVAPSASVVVSGLAAATEYTYVIEAVDANDEASADSAAATATTFP